MSPDPAGAAFASADPLAALRADREAARAASDANAELCWLATVDEDGAPAVRTLVLRALDGERLGLFLNESSPKWRQIEQDRRVEIACWFPTIQRQWRLGGVVGREPGEVVARHWHRRPRIAQLADHLYASRHDQSSEIDQDRIDAALAALDAELPDRPDVPGTALALHLVPERAECMQIRPPPQFHLRQRWRREDGRWNRTALVP